MSTPGGTCLFLPTPYTSVPYSRERGLRAGRRPAACTGCGVRHLPNGHRAVTCDVGEHIVISCAACGRVLVDGVEQRRAAE